MRGLRSVWVLVAATVVVAVAHAVSAGTPTTSSSYEWQIPPWMPPPKVPKSNPMSAVKVELGRRLFYDIRLSGPGYMSCASCHKLNRGLTDGRRVAIGSTGERHTLNTPHLANVGYQSAFTMSDPKLHSLEKQAVLPLFGVRPVEMGALGFEPRILRHLKYNSVYADLFRRAFPEADGGIAFDQILKALAAYQRTLISANAPYDRYRFAGEKSALSPSAKRGEQLFLSERLGCGQCHQGKHLTDAIPTATYHNTGLYNLDGKGGLPEGRRGLIDTTGRAADMGRFKTPSLRNIELTAPYMHDGSLKTLDDVIDHYAAGGRSAGAGLRSPLTSPKVRKFTLSGEGRRDLIAFLRALTDQEFITNVRFGSPFQ